MGFNYVLIFPPLCCPLCFQGSPQTWKWECFLVFGNFSLFKTPFRGQSSIPTLSLPLVSLFLSFIFFSYLLSKTMGYFSGCLMSSASIQKLFCGIYSVFKCSFDEFVGGKVISPSYSSTILGPPASFILIGVHKMYAKTKKSQRVRKLHCLHCIWKLWTAFKTYRPTLNIIFFVNWLAQERCTSSATWINYTYPKDWVL